MKLQVGRWRCRNRVCKRKVFCQRLPGVTGKHGQETTRFTEILRSVAYALGGRAGERLSGRLGLRISDDTLLRRVKRSGECCPHSTSIPVLGVDEWAWRKGYSGYGTILVDLKRRVVADLLPDRSAAGFEKWLPNIPKWRSSAGTVTVCTPMEDTAERRKRNKSRSFSSSAEFDQGRTTRVGASPASSADPRDGVRSQGRQRQARTIATTLRWPEPAAEEIRRQRRQQKVELFRMVKGLQAQGMRAFEVVNATGISRGRVDKWLRLTECPPQNKMAPRPGMAEAFREELRRLWEHGCQNGRELLDEVRKLGYIGSYSGLVSLDQNGARKNERQRKQLWRPGKQGSRRGRQ